MLLLGLLEPCWRLVEGLLGGGGGGGGGCWMFGKGLLGLMFVLFAVLVFAFVFM